MQKRKMDRFLFYNRFNIIINLDTNQLEIYTGFNKVPTQNRYAKYRDLEYNNGYCECKLVYSFDLTNIPENWIQVLNKKEEE